MNRIPRNLCLILVLLLLSMLITSVASAQEGPKLDSWTTTIEIQKVGNTIAASVGEVVSYGRGCPKAALAYLKAQRADTLRDKRFWRREGRIQRRACGGRR